MTIELLIDADPDKIISDVKSAVDRITTFPRIQKSLKLPCSHFAEVISIILSGEQGLSSLHGIAEQARDALRQEPDITQVDILGVPQRTSVEVSRENLQAYGLTLDELLSRSAQPLWRPGGGSNRWWRVVGTGFRPASHRR